MRLRLYPHVRGDPEEIADFIARDSPRQAARMLRMLRARMRTQLTIPDSIVLSR